MQRSFDENFALRQREQHLAETLRKLRIVFEQTPKSFGFASEIEIIDTALSAPSTAAQ